MSNMTETTICDRCGHPLADHTTDLAAAFGDQCVVELADQHAARVSAAPRMLGQRRTLFYAICTCGWAGASRSTHGNAAREGRSHEEFPEGDRDG